jgi:hypothetical protein
MDLGCVIGSFKPSRANVISGWILSLLCACGAAGFAYMTYMGGRERNWDMPFMGAKDFDWFTFGLMVFVVVGLLGGSGFLAYLAWSLPSVSVDIYENAFTANAGGVSRSFTWSEVRLIRETTLFERAPVLHFPASLLIPKSKSKYYDIIIDEKTQFRHSGTTIKHLKLFARVLAEISALHRIPWEEVEDHN